MVAAWTSGPASVSIRNDALRWRERASGGIARPDRSGEVHFRSQPRGVEPGHCVESSPAWYHDGDDSTAQQRSRRGAGEESPSTHSPLARRCCGLESATSQV
jgi:hypothetical protein